MIQTPQMHSGGGFAGVGGMGIGMPAVHGHQDLGVDPFQMLKEIRVKGYREREAVLSDVSSKLNRIFCSHDASRRSRKSTRPLGQRQNGVREEKTQHETAK